MSDKLGVFQKSFCFFQIVMNGKTPISALQELMAARGLPLPTYIEEAVGTGFKCTVITTGVTAVGFGSSKKAAKHESARQALVKLAVLPKATQIVVLEQSPLRIEKPLKNYVGELNEYSSKNAIKYPEYECVTVSMAGECFFKCTFMGKSFFGKGMNKKDAKQDAAKKMLDLVKSSEPFVPSAYQIAVQRPEVDAKEMSEIFSLYQNLSVKDPTERVSTSSHFDPSPLIKIGEQDSVSELQAKLNREGVEYVIKELQRNPPVVYLKVVGTDLYFMESGVDKEDATRKVLLQVLEVKKSGCSLSTADLMSFN
jgi:dsRNA-specific ribonuclease